MTSQQNILQEGKPTDYKKGTNLSPIRENPSCGVSTPQEKSGSIVPQVLQLYITTTISRASKPIRRFNTDGIRTDTEKIKRGTLTTY